MKQIKPFFIFFIILFYTTSTQASEIYFSLQFNTSNGTPKKHIKSWKIEPFGGSYIYLIYKQKELIQQPKMYVYIDKFNAFTSKYEEYDAQKVFMPSDAKNYAAVKYTFREQGTYKVSFVNAQKKIIKSASIYIDYKSLIAFTTEVNEEGAPSFTKEVFQNLKSNQAFYVFVRPKGQKMNIPYLRCKILKYNNGAFRQVVFEQSYKINKLADFTSLKLKFPSVQLGDYQVRLYTNNGVLFAKKYFKIK